MVNQAIDEAREEAQVEAAFEELRQRVLSGDLKAGDILGKVTPPDGSAETTMTYEGGPPEDETYVPIYASIDGSPSYVPFYMVKKYLGRRHVRDSSVPRHLWGRPIWQLNDPGTFQPGTLKCFFHPEYHDRQRFADMGIMASCTKANIPNAFEQRRHVQVKHKQQWLLIEDEERRERERAQEERLNALLERLVRNQEEPAGRRRRRPAAEDDGEE